MDHLPLVEAFRTDAQAFCAFIDAWRAAELYAPYADALRLLSNLAKSAVDLPFAMAIERTAHVERIDHAQWQTISAEIDKRTHDACAALASDYSDDEEAQVRVSMLVDDLADIYRDLRHGLDLYELEDPDHIAEAVWNWRFGYESHWGAHLFRALLTVHEIRYRLLIE